jgi:hypothetical protein
MTAFESRTIFRAMMGASIRVGRWNHDKRANEIDWKLFLFEVLQLAETLKLGERLYIKDALAAAGSVPEIYRKRPLG